MSETITPDTILMTQGSGKLLDAVSLTVGGNSVEIETMVIRDPGNATQYAEVSGKATQSDKALGVQKLRDAGRSIVQLSAYAQTAGATSSPVVITNLVQNSNWVSSTGVTAFLVPANQTLRLESLQVAAIQQSLTTNTTRQNTIYVTIRVATTNTTAALASGAIAAEVGLPLNHQSTIGKGTGGIEERVFEEGIEIPSGMYVGISFHVNNRTEICQLLGVSCVGYLY
jgi:hypothetical protein